MLSSWIWQTRARVEFEGAGAAGTQLWVVSRAGLISIKLTAGRPQDIIDIQRLEKVSHGEHDA